MRKLLSLLMALLFLPLAAIASLPANPADPEMVTGLLPGYVFLEGIDDGNELRLLMRNPSGELVFIGGVLTADGTWTLTESSPLPEGTILGVENFTHSLGIPGDIYYDCVSIAPYADGTWSVSLIYPYNADNGLFPLRKHVIYENGQAIFGKIGDHPWSDVTVIDWTSLPQSYKEAIAAIDTTNWAVVNNPNPRDRLHLRATPSTAAASLGKYYNRTPVRIRAYGPQWCAVTVCGLEGYMMTEFLAFGEDIDTVNYAGPWLDWKATLSQRRLYTAPSTSADYLLPNWVSDGTDFCILGVSGDFYHVWLSYTEEYFYIRMDDLWEGNG